jgi:hypothetical protein
MRSIGLGEGLSLLGNDLLCDERIMAGRPAFKEAWDWRQSRAKSRPKSRPRFAQGKLSELYGHQVPVMNARKRSASAETPFALMCRPGAVVRQPARGHEVRVRSARKDCKRAVPSDVDNVSRFLEDAYAQARLIL